MDRCDFKLRINVSTGVKIVTWTASFSESVAVKEQQQWSWTVFFPPFQASPTGLMDTGTKAVQLSQIEMFIWLVRSTLL